MSIEFTQYLRPDGRKRMMYCDASSDIETIAHNLQSKGVQFDIEVLSTGIVSMTAWIHDPDDPPLAIELSPNGPEITKAIETLVLNARTSLKSREYE